MVFQDRGGGLGFLGREDAAGHGVGDGGQRLYQIGGTHDRRQSQPNAAAAAGRGDAIEHQPGRRHVASLGGLDYRSNHGLGIAGHQLFGEAGGASPGAGWFARRVTADARDKSPALYPPCNFRIIDISAPQWILERHRILFIAWPLVFIA
jgi:hypothetical protein